MKIAVEVNDYILFLLNLVKKYPYLSLITYPLLQKTYGSSHLDSFGDMFYIIIYNNERIIYEDIKCNFIKFYS